VKTRLRHGLRSGCKFLNALEKWRLRIYCKLHDIDYQEIDNSLTYYENKQHLETFNKSSLEELAKQYGAVYDRMEKAIPIAERYGIIPESEEDPALVYRTVVYVVTRSLVLLKSHLSQFDKQLKFFGNYLEITAQITETTTIMQALEQKGAKISIVGRAMVYQRTWQYIDGQGWRKIA